MHLRQGQPRPGGLGRVFLGAGRLHVRLGLRLTLQETHEAATATTPELFLREAIHYEDDNAARLPTEISDLAKSLGRTTSSFGSDEIGRRVMIREGKQAGGASLLSAAQQREIDERFQARLRELGSDFPYEKYCKINA